MKKTLKRNVWIITVIVVLGLMYLSPPIMFVGVIPVWGQAVDNLDDPNEHLWEEITKMTGSNNHVKRSNIQHMNILNFRFWQNLDIKQVRNAADIQDAEVATVGLFHHVVAFEQGTDYRFCYSVTRGESHWYF